MPSLALQPATVPIDASFPPASAQTLINFVAAYLGVSGLENLQGVLVGETEPGASDRDKVWVKQDAGSGRALGSYIYNGGWVPVPFIVPSGETEPAGAKVGELYFNTKLAALRLYNGTVWTTNLHHAGSTANRPAGAPLGYLYFDADIARLLRQTAQGWTTHDGGVGEIRMVDAATGDEAVTRNPGWAVFAALAGRFPIGSTEDVAPQAEGGVTLDEMKLEWSAQGRSAQGGAREANASFIAALTLNGVETRADGTAYPGLTKIGQDKTVNLKPPYRAVIFLRKEF